jgi:O-antigen/teichoic acid export membrane protein
MRKALVGAIALIVLLTCAFPAAAQGPIRVYYAGPAGMVREALGLSAELQVVADASTAEAFVLNGVIPDAQALASWLRGGAGVVLFLGSQLGAEQVGTALGVPVSLEKRDSPLSLTSARNNSDPILQQIVWGSAPQVRERFDLLSPASDLTPLVLGFEQRSLILGTRKVGNGHVYVFTAFLDAENPQFQDWAYSRYLIYHLTARAAGRMPLAFADYAGSPVPHAAERAMIYAVLAVLMAGSVIAYSLVRRYSMEHPEELDRLVADRAEFEAREVQTDWEEIGFHRPLGGFLLALMLGLVLFVPLIIYQNLILPVYILPSAQALGIWGRVTQFFTLIWNLFDMGTSAAFIKFMAQHRVHDPKRGIQYGQLFVWWQALSGAVQVALFVVLAGTVMPRTAYALYAWSVLVHTFIQIPGFYQVMRHALTGLQRFDYAQILDEALYVVLPMLTQPIFVTAMLVWGRSHPVYGMSTSGLLGLGLAAYAAEALTFLIGLWLYRRVGYNARVLFLAHFDWSTIKSAFAFGSFEMLGSVAWSVGQAVEILITQTRLVNYAEVWGNWVLAQNFVFSYQVLQTLYSNAMPAISETISHARLALSQYYQAVSYQWGGIVSAYIGAVLLAVADRFILGASGPEFVRAAAYAGPLVIWGAIQYPSWVGDNVQLAANHTYLKALLVAGEQIVRIVLAYLLLSRFQINALIIAYFVGLLSKDIVAYFVNARVCYPQRFYWWPSLGAPMLAGAAHFAVLRWSMGLLWRGDQVTSVLIFFIGILPSYPLFAFFYGLCGGWDDGTLAELRRAVDLSSFMRPLAWLFWRATALGASISPLHGRFPIDVRNAALAEARSLMEERVRL